MKQGLVLGLALFSLGGAVPAFAAVAGAPIRVRLSATASVLGPDVALGDVARVSGEDSTRCDRVRKVIVGRAPLPGHPMVIAAETLRVALYKAGFAKGEVLVEEGVESVATESQSFPLADLVPLIREDVLKATGENPADLELTPSEGMNQTLLLPKGKVDVDLRAPQSGLYDGSILYMADLSVGGRKTRTVPCRVTVKIQRTALVVKRRVERGEKLREDLLELKKLPSAQAGRDPVNRMDQAVGRTAGRALFPGQSLQVGDLSDPPVVKRGQEVRCWVTRGNVQLEAQVKALEDGRIGRVIRVMNTGSQKSFKARVLDETTVEAVAGP